MSDLWMITGAAGGLGKAFAAACAKEKMNLFLTDVSPVLLDILAQGIKNEFGVEVHIHASNLANEEGRDELFAWLNASNLRFTGLINVAGMDREGEYAGLSLQFMRTMMQLNMLSSAENIRQILPLRQEGVAFTIINVASLAAFQPMPYKALYAATKRFIVQLTLGIREELKNSGVKVSALCPAGMPTTKGCLDSLEAQGLMGLLTTMNAGEVAGYALKQADKGRAIIIPGLLNRIIYRLSVLSPVALTSRLLARKWSVSIRRRCGNLNPTENMCGTPRLADGERIR